MRILYLCKYEKRGKRILAVSRVKNAERENKTTGKWKEWKSVAVKKKS